jgi:hypothetical protein
MKKSIKITIKHRDTTRTHYVDVVFCSIIEKMLDNYNDTPDKGTEVQR